MVEVFHGLEISRTRIATLFHYAIRGRGLMGNGDDEDNNARFLPRSPHPTPSRSSAQQVYRCLTCSFPLSDSFPFLSGRWRSALGAVCHWRIWDPDPLLLLFYVFLRLSASIVCSCRPGTVLTPLLPLLNPVIFLLRVLTRAIHRILHVHSMERDAWANAVD